MTEDTANKQKIDEGLTLRATPRAVTRLNRKAIIVIAAAGASIVAIAAFYALDPKQRQTAPREELYQVGNAERAEGLQTLPKSYGDVPRLGAPLPGEFGRSALETERAAGITEPLPQQTGALPFQHTPEMDAERAERLRRAQVAQVAMEAGVFFQISTSNEQAQSPATAGTPIADELTALNPFLVDQGQAVESGASVNGGADQNRQSQKLDFLESGPDGSIYNPHALQDPASPYQVMAGTVIAASLITGINSDLPGAVIAQVTEPVYDTVSGRYLLIPQGSRLIGKYDSLVAFGQERALVVWQRIIMPNGSSVVIDNLPGADAAGYAGLADKVDFHTWRLIQGIGLSTLLNVGAELAFDEADSDLSRALERSTQDSISRTGEEIVDRFLNIQPTITVRPGWPLRVLVHKDLVLKPYREQGDVQ